MTALLALCVLASSRPITKTAELVGVWEGLSLCTDKTEFPSVHDEQVVCHAAAKDDRTVMITLNKIVDGKEVAMADQAFPFALDAKAATLVGHIGIGKPTTWTFHLNWSTWTGTAAHSDGRVFRNILVKRQ